MDDLSRTATEDLSSGLDRTEYRCSSLINSLLMDESHRPLWLLPNAIHSNPIRGIIAPSDMLAEQSDAARRWVAATADAGR